MRIALLNQIRFYGGGEKRTLVMAEGFRRRGHSVTILAHGAGELRAAAEGQGIPSVPVDLGHYAAPASVSALLRGYRACAGGRPEAIVTFDERSARVAALAKRLARSSPPVLHYYGLEGAFKNKTWNRRVTDAGVAVYVPNASSPADELRSFGWIALGRIRMIHDGVDPEPILSADPTGLAEALGSGSGDLNVLVAARLVPEKAHAFLLTALEGMDLPALRCRVWIVGDGPEAPALESRRSTMRNGDRIRLLGFRPDLPRLMRAAHVLCHPSRREGAPNAIREAMVAGLPVIATAASGTPDLVRHEATGLLSPVDDVPALRTNLTRALEHPEERTAWGAEGKRIALTEFSEEICLDRWLELIERVSCASSP